MPTANVATLDTQGEFVTDTNPVLGANSWQPPPNSNLQWTWIENSGPFITNGQSSHP